ncbi:hypothetical protein LZ31DRAFT_331549 [Colletotrichum somersetense]|nr:hypothetical protein LZ31DRAFT_331549 [Colletotrichum somersetense]
MQRGLGSSRQKSGMQDAMQRGRADEVDRGGMQTLQYLERYIPTACGMCWCDTLPIPPSVSETSELRDRHRPTVVRRAASSLVCSGSVPWPILASHVRLAAPCFIGVERRKSLFSGSMQYGFPSPMGANMQTPDRPCLGRNGLFTLDTRTEPVDCQNQQVAIESVLSLIGVRIGCGV